MVNVTMACTQKDGIFSGKTEASWPDFPPIKAPCSGFLMKVENWNRIQKFIFDILLLSSHEIR